MSEEAFSIPEKLTEFLTDIIERWEKITKKYLEWGIEGRYRKIHVVNPTIFKIKTPDYVFISKQSIPPDPKYKGYYIATLGYPTYEIYLHIGEIKEGEFELIDVDVEDRETCRCECE